MKKKKTTNKYIRNRRRYGCKAIALFELLISLAIGSLLLTATAVAFEAAFTSYKVNNELAAVSISSRNALHQMCGTIRSAWNDPEVDTIDVNADGTECSLVDANGRSLIYRYSAVDRELQVNLNGSAQWHLMVDNVDPIAANEPIFIAFDPVTPGFPEGTVGLVEIQFKITGKNISQPVIGSAVPRNIVFN